MIHFNVPPFIPTAFEYMKDAVDSHKICGDGKYTKLCNEWIENNLSVHKALLTTSGSTALDMAALLCNVKAGDEVILPSFTFSSTANAFALRGAKLVFVDVRPDTMNIDETKIEEAITEKTKVIVPVHYAGVACEMDTIMELAERYNLFVVEDAAQAITSTYKGRYCGTIGDFGCYSFHETKNLSMGEGGAILINNDRFDYLAEIYREKGTNRTAFFRGQVAKYNWVEYGDSYLQSDLNAAYLWAQLEEIEKIQQDRMKTWNLYWNEFLPFAEKWNIELPTIPNGCEHNAHMFYIKCNSLEQRTRFIKYMKDNDVLCVFHYVPLHSAPAGLKYGRFAGEDKYTTNDSDRLVRLPLYYNMDPKDVDIIIKKVKEFFSGEETRR
ncbi:dTDP-4-amino-4,6-dideoxygalactose transaminase [Selenomonas caprae]|uniref:dTDP-4-amino-4,6-dideoxygalactose transaminase n=1 Tax=Selenomonas caprae TaxID=2606905 RepID=A0A5D6WPE2_9FIRM|nr:dTDP-4-amino-4,6-dideoxygalactose transaminase [Selenomonas caprae]TYZ29817.1 dTDP-4-amino-4,6-dideoxygalactose transaminase [Selenomonas caprae]